jgi:hypothetical protein
MGKELKKVVIKYPFLSRACRFASLLLSMGKKLIGKSGENFPFDQNWQHCKLLFING